MSIQGRKLWSQGFLTLPDRAKLPAPFPKPQVKYVFSYTWMWPTIKGSLTILPHLENDLTYLSGGDSSSEFSINSSLSLVFSSMPGFVFWRNIDALYFLLLVTAQRRSKSTTDTGGILIALSWRIFSDNHFWLVDIRNIHGMRGLLNTRRACSMKKRVDCARKFEYTITIHFYYKSFIFCVSKLIIILWKLIIIF